MSCYDVYGCKQHIPFIINRFGLRCDVARLDSITHPEKYNRNYQKMEDLPEK